MRRRFNQQTRVFLALLCETSAQVRSGVKRRGAGGPGAGPSGLRGRRVVLCRGDTADDVAGRRCVGHRSCGWPHAPMGALRQLAEQAMLAMQRQFWTVERVRALFRYAGIRAQRLCQHGFKRLRCGRYRAGAGMADGDSLKGNQIGQDKRKHCARRS